MNKDVHVYIIMVFCDARREINDDDDDECRRDAYKAEEAYAFRAGTAAAEEPDDGDDGAAADQRDRNPVNNQHRRCRVVFEQHTD